MRENRTSGSEGGEAQTMSFPYPYRLPSCDIPSVGGPSVVRSDRRRRRLLVRS